MSVSVHKKFTETKESPNLYFMNYLKWLVKYRNLYDYFVELDIGEIVGQGKVEQWREEIKQVGLIEKCITVYHPNCVSLEDYDKMIKESASKYVALEGDRPNRKRIAYLPLIDKARTQGVRVHGFAMTKKDIFDTVPFYSVDSTSWKSGAMYGQLIAINKSSVYSHVSSVKTRMNLQKMQRSLVANSLYGQRNLHLSFHKDTRVARNSRLALAINSFSHAETYYTKLWEARGYVWN